MKFLNIIAASSILLVSACSTETIVQEQPFDATNLNKPATLTTDQVKRLTHHTFFEFDSSRLPNAGYVNIESHAKYISSHPNMKVLVQGHSDETGSEDYNRDLGIKRANSVASALMTNGVLQKQIIIRSYSTDKPLSQLSDKMNRRATIIY